MKQTIRNVRAELQKVIKHNLSGITAAKLLIADKNLEITADSVLTVEEVQQVKKIVENSSEEEQRQFYYYMDVHNRVKDYAKSLISICANITSSNVLLKSYIHINELTHTLGRFAAIVNTLDSDNPEVKEALEEVREKFATEILQRKKDSKRLEYYSVFTIDKFPQYFLVGRLPAKITAEIEIMQLQYEILAKGYLVIKYFEEIEELQGIFPDFLTEYIEKTVYFFPGTEYKKYCRAHKERIALLKAEIERLNQEIDEKAIEALEIDYFAEPATELQGDKLKLITPLLAQEAYKASLRVEEGAYISPKSNKIPNWEKTLASIKEEKIKDYINSLLG